MITIEKIISWTIPLFGNKRIFAYGKLLVSDGKTRRLVTTKEDSSGSYITFNRKRYRIRNNGIRGHSESNTSGNRQRKVGNTYSQCGIQYGEVCGISGNSGRDEHRAVCICCKSNGSGQRQSYEIH